MELIGIGYSPWTEKARWALSYHQIPYRYHEHLLIFGVPALRWKLKKWSGGVTVPALIDDENGVRLMDSFDIAKYADQIGKAETLFPEELLQGIEHLNSLSEEALDAARAWVMDRVLKNRDMQLENIPNFIPGFVRSSSAWMTRMGLSYLDYEFGVSAKVLEQRLADMRRVLSEFQKILREKNFGFVLGNRFTYADLLVAATIQIVRPEAGFAQRKMGPSMRVAWETPELLSEFKDLLEWRDQMYAQYRLIKK